MIGPFAANGYEMIGCWRGYGKSENAVQLEQGFKEALPNAEVTVVKGCSASTEPITKTVQDGSVVALHEADKEFDLETCVAAAQAADHIVLCLGETAGLTGENQSRAELGFTGRQQEIYDAVAKLGKPFVTLVFCGRPLVLPEVWRTSNAVLYCWQPGVEAGHGIADVVLGKFAPEGRLSMSIPKTQMQVPCNYNMTLGGRPWWGDYRDTADLGPKFWFGYGLTYTTFAYTDTKVVGNRAVCTVTNTGSRDGVEVVQLYVHPQVCRGGWQPIRSLRDFKKIALKSGESRKVEFPLSRATIAYTERDGSVVSDLGVVDVWIAPSAQCREKEHWDTVKAAQWSAL